MNGAQPSLVSFRDDAADTVLNALPHPILMVAADGKIVTEPGHGRYVRRSEFAA